MAELAVRAWQTAAREIILTNESSLALEAKFLRDLQENAAGILLIERRGQICGWGAYIPQSNYISDLWVDPDYHGQGLGCALLDALMAQVFLNGFTNVQIGTHADNLRAIRLYEKLGFRIYERSKEWSASFGGCVDKVRMRADL
ncbi:GNAT family N-acetyltransferase [Brucella gallinifaecis]|uniref:GNAT family N-acetyltransferase n=1 Tax=Brucella gallinifaecis TaxID=215590 RepID=A0A502BTY7_9HYPH|nr:GNAT family N-acetyltransferase [Brucella gallinifaecis]TPF77121.1 GNAT family N-acetyltransferase [Brucella gallinifaecis]